MKKIPSHAIYYLYAILFHSIQIEATWKKPARFKIVPILSSSSSPLSFSTASKNVQLISPFRGDDNSTNTTTEHHPSNSNNTNNSYVSPGERIALKSITSSLSNNLNITNLISTDYLKKKGSDLVNNINVTHLISTDYFFKKSTDFLSGNQKIVLIRGGGTASSFGAINNISESKIASYEYNSHENSGDEFNSMDKVAKLCSKLALIKVSFDVIIKIIFGDDHSLFDEIASKLLSKETHKAMKTIRDILTNSTDHGVIDVFKEYPTGDVIFSFIALSRLQRYSSYYEDDFLSSNNHDHEKDRKNPELIIASVSNLINNRRARRKKPIVLDQNLVNDLAHYAGFANAAYGWKLRLLLSGKIHTGNMKLLTDHTGVDEENIVDANWKAMTHLPAYYIVRDVKRKNIVLCIRGTLSPRDVLTDLCCTAEDFVANEAIDSKISKSSELYKSKYMGRAHQGMIQSARGIEAKARAIIANEFAIHPDYDLVIVGHSLGGGVAAILGTMWKYTFPGRTVLAYGCPCVGPIDTNPTTDSSIISVVGEGDPFSTLSLGHLADATTVLSKLCENESLRNEILEKTQGELDNAGEDQLKWCYDTLNDFRSKMTGEKFYPPGRILFMGGAVFGNKNGGVTLKEVRTEKFETLMLHPFMFDLSRHVPNRYESALQKFRTHTAINHE